MAAIRTQREIRQRAPWWFFGLLALNFALMTYDARDESTKQRKIRTVAQSIAYPFQWTASSVGNLVGGLFGGVGELRRASTENQQLRAQVEQMQNELRDTRQKASQAERLEKLLKLNEQTEYSAVTAQVIARDPSLWFDSVTINKGRGAGVEINMPVVTADGIVGRIVSTSPLSAQIMLITDEKSGAGAVVGQLGQSNAVGSIKGMGENGLLDMRYVSGLEKVQLGQSNAIGSIKGMGENGLLDMRYVSGLEKVQLGDIVYTTGQDGIYPPGYSVGPVVELRPGTATQSQVIHIRPSAGLDRLKEVVVLQYRPTKTPELDQSLPNVDKKSKQ